MFLRISLSFLLFSLVVFTSFGQGNSYQFTELPVQFLQVVKNYPLINPSYAAVDSGANIVSGNKMNFGAYRIFRTNYLSATYRFPGSRDSASGNHHGIGLAAITDKEGEFISHNRIYLTYAYKIQLDEDLHVSTGFSMGMVNYVIEGSPISPKGSDLAPDANVGIWLFRRDLYLGVAINQIFNSKLRPLSETTILLRHMNFTAGRTFHLSPSLSLTSSVVLRTAKKNPSNLDFVNLFLIADKVSAGFNYKHHNSLVFIGGMENIPLRQGRHLVGGWFSYSVPFAKYVITNLQPYEITLTYKIR